MSDIGQDASSRGPMGENRSQSAMREKPRNIEKEEDTKSNDGQNRDLRNRNEAKNVKKEQKEPSSTLPRTRPQRSWKPSLKGLEHFQSKDLRIHASYYYTDSKRSREESAKKSSKKQKTSKSSSFKMFEFVDTSEDELLLAQIMEEEERGRPKQKPKSKTQLRATSAAQPKQLQPPRSFQVRPHPNPHQMFRPVQIPDDGQSTEEEPIVPRKDFKPSTTQTSSTKPRESKPPTAPTNDDRESKESKSMDALLYYNIGTSRSRGIN